jgi:hypothetical protein
LAIQVDDSLRPADNEHRLPLDGVGKALEVRLISDAPAAATWIRRYHLFLPKDAGIEDDVQLQLGNRGDIFTARMDELVPSVAGVLQIRTALFAERVVRAMLAELRTLAEGNLGWTQ